MKTSNTATKHMMPGFGEELIQPFLEHFMTFLEYFMIGAFLFLMKSKTGWKAVGKGGSCPRHCEREQSVAGSNPDFLRLFCQVCG